MGLNGSEVIAPLPRAAELDAGVALAPSIDATVDDVIRWHVERVMARHSANKARAAKSRGVDRKTLGRWIARWTT